MKRFNTKYILILLVAASLVTAELVSFAYAYPRTESYSFGTPAVQKVLSGELKDDTQKDGTDAVSHSTGKKEPKQAKPEPELTDEQYLENSLFIGDSRVVGIQLYSGISGMDYFCSEGLTIYDLFEQEIKVNGRGSAVKLTNALAEGKYDRIYLEIGINEMGQGTIDDFMETYAKTAAALQSACPDADIFLCSIMNVTKSRDETDKVFNNRRIGNRNRRIEKLCTEKGYHYLDINSYVCSKEGNLKSEYSEDSCHLKGKYDYLWKECILENRIY